MPLTSPYQDNALTPAPQADTGFKVSKPGYDVNRTSGQNMIFNSSWPSLAIAYEKIIPTPSGAITVPHNLKFPPFTMAWAYNPDPSGIGNVGSRLFPTVDSTNVYLNTTAAKIIVRCFRLDLSRDIDYTLAPGDSFNGPYDPNYGIKFVKPNKDINSRDLRDFAVHSRAQSPLILSVKTEKTIPSANVGTGIGNVVQYTSKLKYPAWVYAYTKQSTGKYVFAPYYSQSYPRLFTDGFKAYIGYTGTDIGATIVILRDPMFAAQQTSIQY